MGTRIGIDLGGTKIELVVLDADGRERWRRRVPTPQGDYGGTLRAIAALVEEAERLTGAGARIGVGTPGSPSPRDGRIRNANSTCLNGQPLQQDLEALLRRPLRLANDANCLAMSEAADGAGAGARTVFAAILGTGVGGGIVVDGKLLVGANAVDDNTFALYRQIAVQRDRGVIGADEAQSRMEARLRDWLRRRPKYTPKPADPAFTQFLLKLYRLPPLGY